MKHSAKIAAALLAGTMAVSLGLTGCGEQSAGTEPSQATSQATQQSTTKADSLTIAITNDENTLAPYTYVSGTGLVTNRLIYDTLLKHNRRNTISNAEHINNIEMMKNNITNKICPRCGSQLVLRHGKYGNFMGCSRYPQCRFIKK